MRRRLIVIAAVAVVLLLAGLTLYRQRNTRRNEAANNARSDTRLDTTSVPPFPTKEPKTYEATRIISSSLSSANAAAQLHTNQILVARDGEQRREEYEAGALGSIVFLENQSGRFILLPQAKLYADANEPSDSAQAAQLQVETELTAPDLLLNESSAILQYQKLGTEVIAGRTATKYKVVNSNSTATNETFIWVDETLGMPIATQYSGNNGEISTSIFMQLQNIRTEVDPKIFALPVGYRKVAAAEILTMIRAGRATPDVQTNQK